MIGASESKARNVCFGDMVDGSRRSGEVLAITSGKGGVGKTNIAVNLGVCLAGSGKRVVLVDGDLSLGNLDVIMNVNSKYNISHILRGRKSIGEIIHVGPEGLEVICGVSGLEELANLSEFQRRRVMVELSKLQADTDIMLIDTAAGISRTVVGFCLASDHVLVVTTPESTAMTDAYAMVKVLVGNGFEGRISVLVNMAERIAEGKRAYRQIANVAQRFLNVHVYNAGVLLRDSKVVSAVRARKPAVLSYPNSDISRSLVALAARLGKVSGRRWSEREGFFRQVFKWVF